MHKFESKYFSNYIDIILASCDDNNKAYQPNLRKKEVHTP